jgi:hypothetical protein
MGKLKSRKFWLNFAIIITIFVFIWFEKISDSIGLPIIAVAAGIYTAGNVAQKGVISNVGKN